MTGLIHKFLQDEDGTVMVDWVLITASVLGLSLVVMTTIGGSVEALSQDTAETVVNATF